MGARLWGRRGAFRSDWATAWQSGDFGGRRIDAWDVFAAQSWQVSERGWRPRLTTRLDIASGASGPSEAGGFNPLYASSNYLGEGQFLSLSNLVLATAGVSFAPMSGVAVTADYGLAYRQTERDAVYAGQTRAYAGTRDQVGRFTGGVLRIEPRRRASYDAVS